VPDGKLPGAVRTHDGAPWQIPEAALEAYWQENPPGNVWQRLRATPLWQRTLATLATIGIVLTIINNVTGFFSNLFGAQPAVAWVCQIPLINNVCPPTGTPTAAPTPLPFQPAAAGESLIVIATFDGEFSSDTPHKRIQEGIRQKVAQLADADKLAGLKLRVEVHPQIIPSGEESKPVAIALGNIFSATMVIWGEATGTLIRTNFLNLREPDFAAAEAMHEETERTVRGARPEAYAGFVNQDLPSQMSFLVFFAVGQSYFVDANYEQSAQIIEQGIAALNGITTTRGLADAHFQLGWLYQGPLHQIITATAYYSTAIQLDPKLALAYNNRGVVKRAQGDLAGAIADYDQAIQLDPKDMLAYYNRGIVKRAQGDLRGAIADYDQAIQLDPKDAAAYTNRGVVKQAEGDLRGAIAD